MPPVSAVLLGARRQKSGVETTADADVDSIDSDIDVGVSSKRRAAEDPNENPAYITQKKKKHVTQQSRVMDDIAPAANEAGIRTVLPTFPERARASFKVFQAEFEQYCADNNVAYHVRTSLSYSARNT
jgi:hypothetical protein